jgi:hypothetical protein
LAKEPASPAGAKVDTVDLAVRVERLELEAREIEARARIIEGRVRLDALKTQHGPGGRKKG